MTTPTVTEPGTTTPETPTYESLLTGVTAADGREVLDPATGEVVGRVALGEVTGRIEPAP